LQEFIADFSFVAQKKLARRDSNCIPHMGGEDQEVFDSIRSWLDDWYYFRV